MATGTKFKLGDVTFQVRKNHAFDAFELAYKYAFPERFGWPNPKAIDQTLIQSVDRTGSLIPRDNLSFLPLDYFAFWVRENETIFVPELEDIRTKISENEELSIAIERECFRFIHQCLVPLASKISKSICAIDYSNGALSLDEGINDLIASIRGGSDVDIIEDYFIGKRQVQGARITFITSEEFVYFLAVMHFLHKNSKIYNNTEYSEDFLFEKIVNVFDENYIFHYIQGNADERSAVRNDKTGRYEEPPKISPFRRMNLGVEKLDRILRASRKLTAGETADPSSRESSSPTVPVAEAETTKRMALNFVPSFQREAKAAAESQEFDTTEYFRRAVFAAQAHPELLRSDEVERREAEYRRKLGPSRHHKKG